ncbi:MAG: 16S rRNA (uracil(1498)-N(3))-methyltransferase [Actinomycetota bacterium]|nr:16S rRNA (uracil(1498)-N(3))-methyltransferase [Actinomycetota bacterium]
MSLPVFWRESLADVDGVLLLDGAEGHHAAVVRRLGVGERVRITDGRGSYVEGPVAALGKRSVRVSAADRVSVPAPELRLTVVQAVPKGERAELAVQALVEVGVDRIVPWAAERSQVWLSGERGERLLAKWRAWAFEAGKQARRSWFCEVTAVAHSAAVSVLLAGADAGLVLHEEAAVALGAVSLPSRGEVVLVVGPEGGISADELPAAIRSVRLGDTVLRTSTAGAVAAGVVLAGTRWR